MKLLSKKVVLLIVVVMLLPTVLLAQPGGPNGGNGGNPDAPLDNPVVPIDSNMNLVFLLVGIVFAILVFKRLQKAKK